MKRIFLSWGSTKYLAADSTMHPGVTYRKPNLRLTSQLSQLTSLLILLLSAMSVQAAGPKMGQFYLGMGGGVYDPLFTLDASEVDLAGGDTTTSILISLPGVEDPLELKLIGGSDEPQVKTENIPVISLGGLLGYQMTPEFSAEIGLDLAMIEIDVQRLFILQDVIGENPESIDIQILPPDLLPITFSGIYTFMPNRRISPYLGFGIMIALLDNRRSQSTATDILVLDGGVELGYVAHAGVKLAVSDSMYAFADIKYGRISNPQIDNRFGFPVKIEKYEVRHMRFGVSYPFTIF